MGILEGLLGGVLRLLGQFLMDLVFDVVFYAVGFGTLRIVTLGHYPPAVPDYPGRILVSATGGLAIVAGGVVAWYFGY